MRPVRAKALIINAFALAGRFAFINPYTQGAALGYELIGLSARIIDFCYLQNICNRIVTLKKTNKYNNLEEKYVTLQFVKSTRYTINAFRCNTESYRHIGAL